ncbi:MAG: hypothetical protein V1859_09255 [archaeon]
MDKENKVPSSENNLYDSFYKEYKDKLKSQFESGNTPSLEQNAISQDYLDFKDQFLPGHLTIYEKLCNWSEKIIKIAPDKSKAADITEAIEICHLNVTPTGVTSFSLLFPMFFILGGVMATFILPYIFFGKGSLFFAVFFIMSGLILMIPLTNLPFIFSNSYRLKASNQMVLCIFYIVSYMRHTSNFEMAIKFTADHLSPPLSLDLKKVLWNVETEKFESIKESFDDYLNSWRKWNMEFVESIHIIESSLYEPTEERRVEMLEKSLSLILEETYEKMLHYAHDLQSPMNMLHMLGIILPILGLVILPLAISFMEGVDWYHIAVLYNIVIPASVAYLGKMILSKRPTGYGETDISPNHPELKKIKKSKLKLGPLEIAFSPLLISISIFVVLMLVGLSPFIIHTFDKTEQKSFDIVYNSRSNPPIHTVNSFEEGKKAEYTFLGYKPSKSNAEKIIGPFGLGSSLISIFVTLAFGLGIGYYYKLSTGDIIKIRNKSKQLEEEFASALFQLGNRIGDGIPAEMAFGRVSELMQGSNSGKFFDLVNENITKFGLGVERAIFDPNHGALLQFPSSLIESSMKVFIESAKKGPKIASQALINISIYLREIHKVDERLKDLMAEIISSMNSQIRFLTPAISGIVIGITSMLTSILTKLGQQLSDFGKDGAGGTAMSSAGGLMDMFGDSVPTYYFQVVVGVYIIELVFILTGLINSIQNGVDSVSEKYLLGENIPKSTILYAFISLCVILVFNLVAGMVMNGLNLG